MKEAELRSVQDADRQELAHYKSMAVQELAAVQALAAQHANAADQVTNSRSTEVEVLRAENLRLHAETKKNEADFLKANAMLAQAQDQAQQLLAITAGCCSLTPALSAPGFSAWNEYMINCFSVLIKFQAAAVQCGEGAQRPADGGAGRGGGAGAVGGGGGGGQAHAGGRDNTRYALMLPPPRRRLTAASTSSTHILNPCYFDLNGIL